MRCWRGTTVVDGYGEMIVEAVGDRTEAGRVTEQSSIASEEPTPLYKQLTRLSRMIGKIGIAVSIAIFVAMLAKAYLGGELSTGRLGPDFQGAAAYFYGFGGFDRDGCS